MEFFISGDTVKLNPVTKTNLSMINLWYRQVDSFGFATGGKNPEEIMIEESRSDRFPTFVLGIYPSRKDNCIGLIAGEIKNINEPVLWVRTFLVDTAWQRKQIGSQAFQLLSDYTRRKFHIKKVFVSVSAKNNTGALFWNSLGFRCVKVLHGTESENRLIFIFEKVIQP